MRADHDVLRPAVRRGADVLGDLHAHDGAPLERAQRQRERPHEAGVGLGERLHLELVLRQRPVAGAAAGDPDRGRGARGRAASGAPLGAPVDPVLAQDVADPDREREPGGAQLALVGGGVQQHVLVRGRRVIRGVEPERGEPHVILGAVERHADEPQLVAVATVRREVGPDPLDAQRAGRARARPAADLHGDALSLADARVGELVGPQAGAGVEDAPAREQREVPVGAARPVEPCADEPVGRRGQRPARNAVAGDRAGDTVLTLDAGDRHAERFGADHL
jgi:hypothetical protein